MHIRSGIPSIIVQSTVAATLLSANTMDLFDGSSNGSFNVDLLDGDPLATALGGIGAAPDPPAPPGYGYMVPSQGLTTLSSGAPTTCSSSLYLPGGGNWPASSTHTAVYVSSALPLHRGLGVLQFSGPRMSVAPSVDHLLAQCAALDRSLAALVSFGVYFLLIWHLYFLCLGYLLPVAGNFHIWLACLLWPYYIDSSAIGILLSMCGLIFALPLVLCY